MVAPAQDLRVATKLIRGVQGVIFGTFDPNPTIYLGEGNYECPKAILKPFPLNNLQPQPE